jgi:penicillin-binding protein-related factor A (putative recombinase)
VDFVGVLSGGRFVAFDAKSTRDVHGWSVKVSRRSPANDAAHQWEYLAEVHALGGLAFYLVYAEVPDRVFLALMPFPIGTKRRFTEMIEVAKDGNGWWDWLKTLEEVEQRRVARWP